VLLGLGVMFWTAGFDIIYACQDYDFDSSQPDLHSLPKALGIAGALRVSRVLHVLAFGLFATMLLVPPLGWAYSAGLVAAAALLVFQHSIISPGDLSRVNAAFFTANGVLSLVMCAMALVDVARAAFAA
jgi:4-hydroxybenzoate polyprenyltransferase